MAQFLCRLCRQSGITIVGLSPEERRAFEQTTQPVYQQFAPLIGSDLIERIRQVR